MAKREISNLANINYTYVVESESTPISASSRTNISDTEVTERYSISAVKTVTPEYFAPDDRIAFIITITNSGSESLTNVKITDDLTALSMTYVSGSAVYSINGGVPVSLEEDSGSNVIFTLPVTLDAGDIATVYFLVKTPGEDDIPDTETITNCADITASEISGNVSTNCAVITLRYANIEATKTASSNAINCNGELNYTIRLENTGNIAADSIVVTDQLPEGYSVSRITLNGETLTRGTDYTLTDNLLTITIPGSITEGETDTIIIYGSVACL